MSTPWITTTDLSQAMNDASVATARGTAVITAACDLVRLFTEQEISPVVNGGTVTLDGTGTDALLLPQFPVLNAGTVIENAGTLVVGTDYDLNGNGILLRTPTVTDEGTWYTTWFKGRQNIVATYSHGWAAADVPGDLREVAIQMAKRLHSQDGNVAFESLGQRSVRYSSPASDFTNTEKLVLRRYKRSQ